MGARIATIQRQARELGRLRTGLFNGTNPVRSKTWVITSHGEHYIEAAAEVWGGKVEKWQPQGNGAEQFRVITEVTSLDAILPPGDPLSQSLESWSRGGVQRRCDGMTETLTDEPCLCVAKWGDQFYEVAPKDAACKMTSRLNVILPEMPDIGAWRVETHSFHSANEIAAAVDMLKGALGDRALIPVRLRIEQRTRVAQGKTKHFPVVAVELRGATAGQILSGVGSTAAVGAGGQAAVGGRQAPAIAAPAQPSADPGEHIKAALACQTLDQLTVALKAAQAAGFAKDIGDQSDPVAQAFVGRRRYLTAPAGPGPDAPPAPEQEAAQADAIWSQIVAAAGGFGFDRTADVEAAFQAACRTAPSTATPGQLSEFLRQVQAGRIKPPTGQTYVPATPAPDAANTPDGVPF